MSAARILVVDDDPRLLRVMQLRLEAEGYSVTAVTSAEDALQVLADVRPAFVITDLKMAQGGMDGTDLVVKIQELRPGLPVAVLTGHADIKVAIKATQAGAVDFLTKPVDRDALVQCLDKHLKGTGEVTGDEWGAHFVSRGVFMRTLLEDARRVAPTDAGVLIIGAMGTGKEALARAIHRASKRRDRDILTVDCGALAPEALEAKLFGSKEAPGLIKLADGGTLYLENVNALNADLQGKLMRVLQEKGVRPVGDTGLTLVDVRFIGASQSDLEAQVRAGTFREDLYYKLGVVVLKLPLLSERREDIPTLVAHRLAQLVAEGAPKRVFAPDAMETLVAAAWPGNIGQLFSVVEQTASLSPSRVISAARVRKALGDAPSAMPSFDQARAEFTRNYLRQLLELADGNISRAARLAERNRTDFYKLLTRFGVDATTFKERAP